MSEADTADTRQATVPPRLRRPHDEPVWRIMRQIWDRLNRKNEHFVCPIVGREGIGKSHTAIKIASMIDSSFSSDQVFFRAAEFLEMLRDEQYSRGDMFILDEAGVSFGKRTWADRAQVTANQALQLIRDHNIGLLFSLPRLSELDSQTQGRAHAFFEITHKQDGDHVAGKWKWIDPDRTGTTGKIYKKFPRNGSGQKIHEIGFAPPDPELIEPYEERKGEFQHEVYQDAITKLRGEEGDEDDEAELTPKDISQKILTEDGVRKYLKTINNGSQTVLDWKKIRAEYEIGRRQAKEVKSLLMEEVEVDVI
jgi:hypothetical protein